MHHPSAAMHSLFPDYKPLALPDLSAQRHPPSTRGRISVPVHPACTEEILLVAVARCLGTYCSSDDVVLGWLHQSSDQTKITAVRVSWANSHSWSDILCNISRKEIADSSDLRHMKRDPESETIGFLALISANPHDDHPLVLSIGPLTDSQVGKREHVLHLNFSHRALHQSAAEILARQLEEVIEAIVSRPDTDPSTLSFHSSGLKSSVAIQHATPTYSHLPKCRTVTDYLQDHDPSLTALEFYSNLNDNEELPVDRLTYGELQARSNRFAAYLCDRSLQLEDRVAVCLPRGIEFHISMLGILKAGGCYVPVCTMAFLIEHNSNEFLSR